jgi:hypothetical protein
MDVSFCQTHLARSDRFNFGSLQSDTRLEVFEQKIFKSGFAIGSYDFNAHPVILTYLHVMRG